MKSFQDFVLIAVSLPVLFVAIAITGVCWVGLIVYAVADELLTYAVKRKLWGCKWCDATFKRGGRRVWFPRYGQFQGHGCCASCFKKLLPDVPMPRGDRGAIMIELICALLFAAIVVVAALL